VFPGDRGEIRERAAQAALDMLRRALTHGSGSVEARTARTGG